MEQQFSFWLDVKASLSTGKRKAMVEWGRPNGHGRAARDS